MPTCMESIAPPVVVHAPCELPEPANIAQLPGVDAALDRALRERGVLRVEQLRRLPKPVLVAAFGDSVGGQLWASARGLDGQPKRTMWTQMRAGAGRLRRWLAAGPRPTRGTVTAAISSPDTAKA